MAILLAIVLAAPADTKAGTIDFTGLDLAAVASPTGQNFTYEVGFGSNTGSINVRLISGTPSSLQTGSSPDTKGFYALQTNINPPPMVFRFTFDTIRSFTIRENETQATIEFNSFTLSSGTWTLLSASNTTPTISESNISFTALNDSPPYGDYVIAGIGSSFDYQITNSPGFPVYGSAISINIMSDPIPVSGLVITRAVKLRWQTESGKTYQPQYSYDLSAWTNFGSPIPGNDQFMEVFDSTESDQKKFYRIQSQ